MSLNEPEILVESVSPDGLATAFLEADKRVAHLYILRGAEEDREVRSC
jgi:hypothetical protein